MSDEKALVVGTVAIAEASKNVGDVTDVLQDSRTLIVKNQVDYDGAFKLGRAIKALIAKVKETFDPICEQANRVHKTATETRKKHLQPLEEAMKLVAQKMIDFTKRQEAKRLEAERKERERLEKQEEERRLREAEKLEEKGLHEAAEEMLDEPIITPSPSESVRVKQFEVEKPKGLSQRENWQFDILDPSKIKREFLMPDEQKIRKLVKAMKVEAIPVVGSGSIKVYDAGSVSIRE